eukprot:TRINITY_DN520_c0_g1_i1.p1 TRINITY_DN520_c0_g1~~TRINITY_DN520_c0_g1_i1.p1  ORF type:complete len:344 (+),score=126.70 TRINITY_DN520_c0_g1_i1:106-1137(+)
MGDIAEAKQQAEGLKQEIKSLVDGAKSTGILEAGGSGAEQKLAMKTRRELRGHAQKIFAIEWSKSKPFLVSAAQDGRLIYWDAQAALKETVVVLRSFWVMAVALSPSDKFAASGGLDNIVSIFNLERSDDGVVHKPDKELTGHGAFISALAFTSEKDLLSCSGDCTVRHWDIEAKSLARTYEGHDADVSCIDLRNDMMATGSGDHTLKIWNKSDANPVHTLRGHTRDINAIQWVNDNVLVSGGADHQVCLWDVRASQSMLSIMINDQPEECTAVTASQSGRFLFAGSSGDPKIHVFDSLTGQLATGLGGGRVGHKGRVSYLDRSFDGLAIASASWDQTIRIWA